MSQIASSKLYCSSTIGFPRIGSKREMKKALESYWSGGLSGEALLLAAEEVDARAWKEQADMGVDLVALDGTLYDHVLDFAVTYLWSECPALDMSKYFDTNYHHLAPDVEGDMTPNANWGPLLEKVKKGQRVIGVDKAVPLILGPLTLAYLCRGSFDSLNLNLLKALIPHYVELMGRLGELGVPEVQAMYQCVINLPVHAIGFDFCGVPGATSGNEMFTLIATHGFPQSKRLGAGVVDGRSVWKDTNEAMNVLLSLKRLLGNSQSICVQTSTSLQHVPYDVMLEDNCDPTLREKLSFAYKKGQISETEYREAIAAEIGYCIGIQEALDLDVLVHGEAERSDMMGPIIWIKIGNQRCQTRGPDWTHLCYSEFEDILESIDALHADVLTIENSRSSDEMMQYLASYGYKRDIGPGVYDVHSPIVPPVETMLAKIESFIQAGIVQGDVHRIHINPDCGLKTRRWERGDIYPSLKTWLLLPRKPEEGLINM
eukprot:jgi/Picre1/28604/NNA_004004.t1